LILFLSSQEISFYFSLCFFGNNLRSPPPPSSSYFFDLFVFWILKSIDKAKSMDYLRIAKLTIKNPWLLNPQVHVKRVD